MGARVFDGTPEGLVLLYPMGSSGYEEAVFSYSAQPFFLVQYLDTASDGGQVPKDDGRYKEGDEVVAQGNIGNLTKEGHTFIGWKDEEGNVYQEGDAIPVGTNHVQLVPHWEINRYQVVFHSNGGGDLEDMEVEWNSTIPEPKKLERKDHIFVNWFKDKDFKEVWNFQGQRAVSYTHLGKIDGFDMMEIKRHYLKIKQLSGERFKAADINNNGVVDGFDMMEIKRHYLGIKKIKG